MSGVGEAEEVRQGDGGDEEEKREGGEAGVPWSAGEEAAKGEEEGGPKEETEDEEAGSFESSHGTVRGVGAELAGGEEDGNEFAFQAMRGGRGVGADEGESGALMEVVEGPLAGEDVAAVEVGVELVEGGAGRGWVVGEEGVDVALVEVDAVERGAEGVAAGGVMLPERPAGRGGEDEQQGKGGLGGLTSALEDVEQGQDGDGWGHGGFGKVEGGGGEAEDCWRGEAARAGREEKKGDAEGEEAVGVALLDLEVDDVGEKGREEEGKDEERGSDEARGPADGKTAAAKGDACFKWKQKQDDLEDGDGKEVIAEEQRAEGDDGRGNRHAGSVEADGVAKGTHGFCADGEALAVKKGESSGADEV